MIQDMTQGNPTRLLLTFAVPILLGNLAQQLYSTAGAVIVGKGVSVDALAAIGVTTSMNFMILGFAIGLTHGFSILVSQRFGAHNDQGVKKAVCMSVLLSFATSIFITILSLHVSMPLLRLLNTPENIIQDANLYIQVLFGATTASIFLNLFSAFLRALGDSRTPLVALVLSTIVNILFTLLFVLVFRWGVAGAALGTVTAQVFTCIYCFLAMRRIPQFQLTKEDWQPERKTLLELLKLGLPVGLMNSVTAIGLMILQSVVNGFGSAYVAAFTAGGRIVGLSQQPGQAFGLAMATYTGQNLGAGRIDRIKSGVRKCIMLSTLFNAAVAAVLLLFPKQLTLLMVDASEAEVIGITQQYLTVCALFLGVLGLLFIYRCALQGLGNTLVPMVSGGLELLLRVAASTLLPPLIGFYGIGFSEVSAWTGAGLLLMIAYYMSIRRMERSRASQNEFV